MKIGILTLPLHTNYGGLLQAYALQKYLTDIGHDVLILDTDKHPNIRPWYFRPAIWGYHLFLRYIKHKKIEIFTESSQKRIYKEYLETSQNTQLFIDKYLRLRIYRKLSEINEDEFDAIVVGSDQVWRAKYYFGSNIKDAFLDFTKGWNIKRIAYAASFGTDEWEYNDKQTKECVEAIKRFDFISVREDFAVELCKEYLDAVAVHVLDPTMLLKRDDYDKIIENSKTEVHKGDLLVYMLDDNELNKEILNKIVKNYSLIPFRVNSKVENCNANLKERIQPSVESWLRGFRDAKFVVTDSFHACIFSIIFRKPFIVIGNKNRGLGRFYSLLRLFELQDHLVLSSEDFNPNIDYEIPSSVLVKLDYLREQSKKQLNLNL